MAADVVALPKPAAVTTLQGATFSVGADLGITDGAAAPPRSWPPT